MINAKQAAIKANRFNEEKVAKMRENVEMFAAGDLTAKIEAAANAGEYCTSIFKPDNVNTEMLVEYVKKHGFSVVFVGHECRVQWLPADAER